MAGSPGHGSRRTGWSPGSRRPSRRTGCPAGKVRLKRSALIGVSANETVCGMNGLLLPAWLRFPTPGRFR